MITSLMWVAVDKWGTRLSSLATFVVLARVLSPAEFGVAAIATAFIRLMQVFADSGIASAIVQRPNATAKTEQTAFSLNLLMCLLLFGGIQFAAPAVAAHYGYPTLEPLLRLLACSLILFGLAGVPAALLQRRQQFRALALRRSLGTLVGSVCAVVAALTGAGVYTFAIQLLVSNLVALIILWVAAGVGLRPGWDGGEAVGLLRFGSGVLASNLLGATLLQGTPLILGIYFSAEALGYFSIATSTVAILLDLLGNLVATVSFARMSQAIDALARGVEYAASAKIVYGAAFPILLTMVVIAPEAVPFVYGAEMEPAAEILAILGLAAIAQVTIYNDRVFLLASGHPFVPVIFDGASVAIRLSSVGLLAGFGPTAAALAILGQALLTLPLQVFLLARYAGHPTGLYAKAFFPPLVRSALLAALCFLSLFFVRSAFTGTALTAMSLSLGALNLVASWLWNTPDRKSAFSRLRRRVSTRSAAKKGLT